MNRQFKTKPDHKQSQEIQSFYEPVLVMLNNMYQVKRGNLERRGYPADNAAVTKEELAQQMAYCLKITIWLAHQVIASLVKADQVISFGGYLKPKVGEL
ncbi:hypothetical protein [Acinetobacter gerneri]|jgi:hypothetical protein|uniref:hypothetical protein n=1 Tax=Acinetobacter gerneri TaxID=202952 RepID=UPI0023F1FEFC|nr:hypothetical protein [Acinetobacter gerneri]MCH4245962.1 hypothetical protein [Acinetobacter gerneri]